MSDSALLQKIGFTINQNKLRIAQEVVDSIYSVSKQELLEKYELTRERIYEFAKYDISKLFTSIISERPEIFAKYIAWQRSMMETREVPLIIVKMNLSIFQQVLKSILNEESHRIINSYFEMAESELMRHLPEPETFIDANDKFGKIADNYLKLLLNNQKDEAIEVIFNAYRAGVSLSDIYVKVLQPAQYEVGMLWQYNKISVAKEHYVTEVTKEVMTLLYPVIDKLPKNGKVLLSACLSGELHDMGLRFVTEYFKINGWDALYFGANTPKHDLLREIKHTQPDIIAISATTSSQLYMAKSLIESIRNLYVKSKIIVGGYVFNQAHGTYLYVEPDGYAPDAVSALEVAEQLLR